MIGNIKFNFSAKMVPKSNDLVDNKQQEVDETLNLTGVDKNLYDIETKVKKLESDRSHLVEPEEIKKLDASIAKLKVEQFWIRLDWLNRSKVNVDKKIDKFNEIINDKKYELSLTDDIVKKTAIEADLNMLKLYERKFNTIKEKGENYLDFEWSAPSPEIVPNPNRIMRYGKKQEKIDESANLTGIDKELHDIEHKLSERKLDRLYSDGHFHSEIIDADIDKLEKEVYKVRLAWLKGSQAGNDKKLNKVNEMIKDKNFELKYADNESSKLRLESEILMLKTYQNKFSPEKDDVEKNDDFEFGG